MNPLIMGENTPSFRVTENDDHFARFRWKIDISSIQYSGSLIDIGRTEQSTNSLVINSDKFSIDPYDSIEWQITVLLSCNFGTVRVGTDRYFFEIDFGIILKGENFDNNNVKAVLCYNVLDNDSVMYTKNPILNCSYPNSNTETQQKHLLSPVYSNNSLVFFRNSLLTIEGHITLQEDCRLLIEKSELVNLRQLQQDWKWALKDKRFVDVSLQVEGSILHAHNIVLSSRSPVFRKMFESDMIENSENAVNIEDVSKNTMEAFILFLYTGEIEDHTYGSVADLYYAADKYEVKSLQDTCRDLLVCYLSVGTALNILELSDRHSDSYLKDTTTNFIHDNFQEIFITNEWKFFVDSHPYLASHILNCISLRMLKL